MKRILCSKMVKEAFTMSNTSRLSGAPYTFTPGKATDVLDADAGYLMQGNEAVFSFVEGDVPDASSKGVSVATTTATAKKPSESLQKRKKKAASAS